MQAARVSRARKMDQTSKRDEADDETDDKTLSASLESDDERQINREDSLSNLLRGSINSTNSSSTTPTSTRPWFKFITVEPVILLYSFAFTLTSPVLTTLYLTHTCRDMGFNQSYCSELEGTSNAELETLVQPGANLMKLYEMLIETGLPAVLTLFIGPWSDLYGRKTFMLIPILGSSIKYIMIVGMSFYPALPTRFLLIASVPVALSGGFISVISMCYCYISDISHVSRRGFRMGIVESCFYAGLLLGTTTTTYIFAVGRYHVIFAVGAGLCLSAFTLGHCFVQESIQNIQERRGCSSIFAPHLVKDMFEACCKQRHRNIIVMIIAALALTVLTLEGESTTVFLFTRHKFSWDIEHFMIYASTSLVLQIVGTITALTTLSVWLGVSDGVLAAGSFALKAVASVLFALSPAAWWMYMAAAVAMFGSVAGPLARSIISKAVDPQDVGKVFSLVSSMEAITPLAAGPLYALIYNSTLVSFPGAFFLVSAAMFVINLCILGVVVYLQRRLPVTYASLIQS